MFKLEFKNSYLVLWILSFSYMIFGNLRLPWLILDIFSLILISKYLLINSKNGRVKISTKSGLFTGAFLVLFLLINILINGIEFISIIKLWDTFKYIPLFIYFNKVFDSKSEKFIQFYKSYYNFLTIVFVINHILIFFQAFTLTEIDFATGTFGGESSHTIGFFWVLLMLMQINQRHDIRFLLTAFSSIILSILVDNNSAIYLILLNFIYLCYLRFKNGEIINVIKIGFVTGLSVLTTFIFLLTFLNKVAFNLGHGSLDTYLNVRTFRAVNIYLGRNSEVEDERLKILKKVFRINETLFFGSGIGKGSEINNIKGSMYRKIDTHLTINEIGLHSYEIGIWGFLLVIITYTLVFSKSVKKANFKSRFILLFWLLILFSIKCDWIYDDRSCLFVFLIFSLGFYVPKVNKIYSKQRQIITY